MGTTPAQKFMGRISAFKIYLRKLPVKCQFANFMI